MSYDIYLLDAETQAVLEMPEGQRAPNGGTYAMGGSDMAWVNVTYNYARHFRNFLHAETGIRWLYGKKARDTGAVLNAAINAMQDNESDDYWEPTEGNARRALIGLRDMALALPDGVWSGD